LLYLAVSPLLIRELIEFMKEHPYSISTDGSNDTRVDKMNPVTVNIFDLKNFFFVVTQYLNYV